MNPKINIAISPRASEFITEQKHKAEIVNHLLSMTKKHPVWQPNKFIDTTCEYLNPKDGVKKTLNIGLDYKTDGTYLVIIQLPDEKQIDIRCENCNLWFNIKLKKCPECSKIAKDGQNRHGESK